MAAVKQQSILRYIKAMDHDFEEWTMMRQAQVLDPKPAAKSVQHTRAESGSDTFGGQTPAELLQGVAKVPLACPPGMLPLHRRPETSN